MPVRPCLSVLLLFTLVSTAAAQNQKSDSIFALLIKHPSQDTARARLLCEYSASCYPGTPDSAFKYGELGYQLSYKLNYAYGLMRCLNLRAIKAWSGNQLQEALAIYRQAYVYALAANDQVFQGKVLSNIGMLYRSMGSTDSAQLYLKRALAMAVKLGDSKLEGRCLNEIGTLSGIQGHYVQSVQYLLQALRIWEKLGLLRELTSCHIQLGNFYCFTKDFNKSKAEYMQAKILNDSLKEARFKADIFHNLGLLYLDVKKDQDSARIFLLEAYDLANQIKAVDIILTTTLNLGNICFNKKDYPTALKYFLESAASPRLQGRLLEQTAVFVNLGTVYMRLGNLGESEKFLRRGMSIARKNGFLEFQQKAGESMAALAVKQGRLKQAYEYLRSAADLTDSISGMEIRNQVADAGFRYELEKMETQNSLLVKQNELQEQVILRQRLIVGGSIFVVLLIMVLLLIIFRSRVKLKKLNTRLDEQNKELLNLNHTKDKFFSIIAHDLKSPFNALMGLLTELDESYDEFDEPMRRQIISNLKKSSFNTYNLLVNLLDWANAQKGNFVNNAKNAGLSDIVDEVFGILQTRAEMKSLQLINDVSKEIAVHADPNLLSSVLINMVNNGIKFTPVTGKIRVYAVPEGGMMKVFVEDTGIGIPEKEIEKLFRIDSSFKRQGTEKEPGTGLGLILCKEHVDLIGGEISVSSVEGKGTTFCFTVPCKVKE